MKVVGVLLACSLFIVVPNISYAVTTSAPHTTISSISNLRETGTCKGSPLHEAVRDSNLVSVNALAKDVENLYAPDCNGRWPMHLAVETSNEQVVVALLENHFDVNRRSEGRRTVLMHAAVVGSLEVVETLHSSGARLDTTDANGSTALLEAAVAGRTDVVNLLVRLGADPNKRLPRGFSYLHIAAAKDAFKLVKLFAELGTSIDSTNDDGDTAASIAVEKDNPTIINYLSHKGANLTRTDAVGKNFIHKAVEENKSQALLALIENDALSSIPNDKGGTDFALIMDGVSTDVMKTIIPNIDNISTTLASGNSYFHEAVGKNNEAVVQLLLDNGVPVDLVNNKDETALTIALKKGFIDIMKSLIIHNANLSRISESGESYLHTAVRYNRSAAVQLLLDSGIPIDITNDNDETGLDIAVKEGFIGIMRSLISHKANVSRKSRSGNSYLHTAVINNRTGAVQLLLDSGVPIDTVNNKDETPLTIAVKEGYIEIIKFLISRNANVTRLSQFGDTYLHEAAEHNQTTAAELLLEYGVPIDVTNSKNETAVTIAIEKDNDKFLEILINNKAHLEKGPQDGLTYGKIAIANEALKSSRVLFKHGYSEPGVDDRDTLGHNAIYYAVENDEADKAAVLADLGADLNQVYENNSKTLLHVAAEHNSYEAAKWLIDRGLSVNATTGSGWTPLHYAARQGSGLGMTELLIEKGACICCKTSDGSTPLHFAASSGSMAIIRLTNNGACINSRDSRGRTPLYLANVSRHTHTVNFLKSKSAVM